MEIENKITITKDMEERLDLFLTAHSISKKCFSYRLLKEAVIIAYQQPNMAVLDVCAKIAEKVNMSPQGVYSSLRRLIQKATHIDAECYGVKEFIYFCINSIDSVVES